MRKVFATTATAAGSLSLLWTFVSALSPLPVAAPTTEGLLLVDVLVRDVVLIGGAGLCLWYFLTACAVLFSSLLRILGQRSPGFEGLISRVGAPLLRRAVHVTAASSLVLTAPAFAAPSGLEDGPAVSVTSVSETRNTTGLVDLGWAPSSPPPTPPTARAARPPETPERPVDPVEGHDSHVVDEGDSLWTIAEAHLVAEGRDASSRSIAAHWPRWHTHNHSIIGPDPNLIVPGQHLQAPPKEES